jgi:N-acetylneuraminic acid mutarotase
MARYMAAAATMGDGRILITGGYDRPAGPGAAPQPLSSAMIYDPASGQWTSAAPMGLPRARHAAVALSDGRVAVVGGISIQPTGSVEIYDPRTNKWTAGGALAQPRYDHAAAASGQEIVVMGGSSQTMLGSVEVVRPDAVQKTP